MFLVNDSPLGGTIQIKENESSFGKNMKGIKDVDSSSHYVCGRFAMVANGLNLLENMDDHIHFPQIFVERPMGGSPRYKFRKQTMHFSFVINVCCVNTATCGLACFTIFDT
jgi:hypothetical protein